MFNSLDQCQKLMRKPYQMFRLRLLNTAASKIYFPPLPGARQAIQGRARLRLSWSNSIVLTWCLSLAGSIPMIIFHLINSRFSNNVCTFIFIHVPLCWFGDSDKTLPMFCHPAKRNIDIVRCKKTIVTWRIKPNKKNVMRGDNYE